MRCLVVALVLTAGAAGAQWSRPVEEIRSTGGLAPHVVGQFHTPAGFQQASTGDYYVFDRRSHSVSRVDASGAAMPIVRIGPEDGRLLGASAFHMAPDGRFVVADAPEGRERVQIFESDGTRIGGFRLPGRAAPRITLGDLVLTGIASLQFTGRAVLMSQPELGGLMTEFSLAGHPFHTFGVFRRTGHEADRDVHLALNSGLPLVNPRGGYYFVFQAGVPVFRKYDANAQLVFERHVGGPRARSPDSGPAHHLAAPADRPRADRAHRPADRPRGGRRPGRVLVDRPDRPVRLRVRPGRREGAHAQAPRRRRHRADQPVVRRPRPPARHARLLRVHGAVDVAAAPSGRAAAWDGCCRALAAGPASSAVNTVTACPINFTRPPSTRTRSTPPRADA